jgi:hypothetical protein
MDIDEKINRLLSKVRAVHRLHLAKLFDIEIRASTGIHHFKETPL